MTIIAITLGSLLVLGALFLLFFSKDGKQRNSSAQVYEQQDKLPLNPSGNTGIPSEHPQLNLPEGEIMEEQAHVTSSVENLPLRDDIEIPFGIKYARCLNWINIVLLFVVALIMWFFVIPMALRENMCPLSLPLIFIALIVIAIYLSYAYLLFKINQGLLEFKPWAKKWQTILSVLGLFSFPIGTICYGFCLNYMTRDTKVKEAFEKANSRLWSSNP